MHSPRLPRQRSLSLHRPPALIADSELTSATVGEPLTEDLLHYRRILRAMAKHPVLSRDPFNAAHLALDDDEAEEVLAVQHKLVTLLPTQTSGPQHVLAQRLVAGLDAIDKELLRVPATQATALQSSLLVLHALGRLVKHSPVVHVCLGARHAILVGGTLATWPGFSAALRQQLCTLSAAHVRVADLLALRQGTARDGDFVAAFERAYAALPRDTDFELHLFLNAIDNDITRDRILAANPRDYAEARELFLGDGRDRRLAQRRVHPPHRSGSLAVKTSSALARAHADQRLGRLGSRSRSDTGNHDKTSKPCKLQDAAPAAARPPLARARSATVDPGTDRAEERIERGVTHARAGTGRAASVGVSSARFH